MKTTSIYTLSADRGLNRLDQKLYWLLNRINNSFQYFHLDKDLVIRDFSCEGLRECWSKLNLKSSPSRKLSDLFWLNLPWMNISKELGEIHIFDIGCGSGDYGCRLTRWSGNRVVSYTGADISRSENWLALQNKCSNFEFYWCAYSEILGYIPDRTNFFISQSAVEHFDEDLFFFEQIRNYIKARRKSTLQVHLMPSAACLELYGLHGVRQYTPRTISRIFRLFKDFSYGILFRLGGRECNRLHYEFITQPIMAGMGDLRDVKTREYDQKALVAIEQDMKGPQSSPAFYALVIQSYWTNKLFYTIPLLHWG